MWEDGTVFDCYTNMWDVIFYSELGSSWTVLAAGYSVDTLMLRYQGVDWTNLNNWDCNARLAAQHPCSSTKFSLLCAVYMARVHEVSKQVGCSANASPCLMKFQVVCLQNCYLQFKLLVILW